MSSRSAIKVGVIADQTGPLSFVGIANATVARMVIGDINAEGGLLGRRLELCLADSATDDAVAAEKAEKLVREDGVNVILGSICSSTRQAIKGPAVVEGKTLYIYPSSTRARSPTRSSPAPVRARAAGRSAHPVADGEDGWEEVYPSADYIWPHVLNERVKKAVVANGGEILGEEYHPLDHMDYAATVERITASGDDVVFNTILPSGLTPFFEGLYDSGFASRGGQLVCTYMDENFLNIMPAGHCQGRRLPRLLPGRRGSVQPEPPLAVRGALPRRGEVHGGACSGLYRGLRLWAAAVSEAGSLDQDAVIAALDRAEIAEGPGGPAAMVPGQHHLRLHMYIAQARSGRFEIVESLGAIDPQERPVEAPALVG